MKRRLDVASDAFVSCDDMIYWGDISLGSDHQLMQVILDTGSSDLWVFSSSCYNCPGTIDTYDHGTSSDYVADGKLFQLEYADGDSVSGYLSVDRLAWAGLEIPGQTFAEISSANQFSLVCQEDGLLGMAFDELSDSGASTPFTSLVGLGLLDEPIFSFYLADDDSG